MTGQLSAGCAFFPLPRGGRLDRAAAGNGLRGAAERGRQHSHQAHVVALVERRRRVRGVRRLARRLGIGVVAERVEDRRRPPARAVGVADSAQEPARILVRRGRGDHVDRAPVLVQRVVALGQQLPRSTAAASLLRPPEERRVGLVPDHDVGDVLRARERVHDVRAVLRARLRRDRRRRRRRRRPRPRRDGRAWPRPARAACTCGPRRRASSGRAATSSVTRTALKPTAWWLRTMPFVSSVHLRSSSATPRISPGPAEATPQQARRATRTARGNRIGTEPDFRRPWSEKQGRLEKPGPPAAPPGSRGPGPP